MAQYPKYEISAQRLTGIADQARRLGKVSGKLTPGQIQETLEGVPNVVEKPRPLLESFLTSEYYNLIVSANDFEPGGILEAFPPYELSGAKCYYNDVLLPGIPDEMLARYPYAWIRKDDANGNYNLVFGRESWYYDPKPVLICQDITSLPYYSIPITSSADATEWNFTEEAGGTNFGLATNRTVLWSNHDIPNGSATATEIYFEGSEPVPAE